MPVVPRDDVAISYTLLPLAAATLLVANRAALRSRKDGTEELYGSVPTPVSRRTAAHLLSVIASVELAVGVVITDLVILVRSGGVGRPNPLELATGPAVVALAGAIGVLLARLVPWSGVASVALVGFAASWYFPYLWFRATGHVRILRSYWLFPWFGMPGSPMDWADALAGGRHLAYVGALIALAACLALARSKLRAGAIMATVLALAVTATSAVAQVPPTTVAQQFEEARFASGSPGTQVCGTRGGVEYCVWPAYQDWIDWWQRPIDGVLQRVPAAARGRKLRVRQMELGDYARCWDTSACPQQFHALLERAFTDSDVRPMSSWPRIDGDRNVKGKAELPLALATASWAVGLSAMPPRDSESLTICIPHDEARVVVALWLAGQSTPQAADSLRARTGPPEQARSRLTLGSDAVTAQWPWPEAVYAVALLDRPVEEVAAALQRDWARWVSPATPTAELVEVFGLAPLPAPDERALPSGTGTVSGSQSECV
jgi:hypothetical protein